MKHSIGRQRVRHNQVRQNVSPTIPKAAVPAREIYAKLLEINDRHTEIAMEKQVNDPQSRHDGGIPGDFGGLPSPSHVGTAGSIASMVCSLLNPDSRFYEDAVLSESLERAMAYMVKKQHDDGTISLGTTNFHSPPDTAFVVNGFVEICRLLSGSESPHAARLQAPVMKFLERSVPALLEGGCHTPNHRWVMTAALAGLYRLFGDEALVGRADEWLSEGIDCTEDGEWTERSNGIYNTVSDIMFYYAAKRLNRPELLEYARRNLRMMVYFIHPDGTAVTEYSDRQDYGGKHTMAEYFTVSRLLAAEDREAAFTALSEIAWAGMNHPGPVNNHAMLGWLLNPRMRELEDTGSIVLPDTYTYAVNLTYPYRENLEKAARVGHRGQLRHTSVHPSFGAPVVRIRHRSTSMTLTAGTPSFLSITHAGVRLRGVRMASCFMPGVVVPETLDAERGTYRITGWQSKGYNGPIPKPYLPDLSEDRMSPWILLPHQHRPLTHVQSAGMEIRAAADSQRVKLRIRSLGTGDVPAQLQFLFDPDCAVDGDALFEAYEGRGFFLKSGRMRFGSAEGWIELEGGAYQHAEHEIRNASVPDGMIGVLVNLATPFDHEIAIRFSPQTELLND